MHIFRTILLVALVSVPASAARADYQSARAWFQSLPDDDRLAIQLSLIVTDDYVAFADGVLGPLTYEALIRFQRRHGLSPTGVLSADAVESLLEEAAAFYSEVGFARCRSLRRSRSFKTSN